MAVTREHVGPGTALGATLVADGATFRVWAPAARRVFVLTGARLAAARARTGFEPDPADALAPQGDGTWAGFVKGVADGTHYLFWVQGEAGSGFKRDPRARELSIDPPHPASDCLVRDPASFPWHDAGFRSPEFSELVIYQLHVGAFYGEDAVGRDLRPRIARFLDVLGRLDHLLALRVNAIQFLPVQEYQTDFSLGYNGTDYFSPEMEYQVNDAADLPRYLALVNARLAERGQPALALAQLAPGINQLKALVDVLHVHGLAVIFDLVFNHASSGNFDDASMYFFDRQRNDDPNHSLYFTDREWAGGKAFALWNRDVRQFLIDDTKLFLEEYHIDGIRYDEVSALRNLGGAPADVFCRDVTGTVRFIRSQAIQIAEYWNDDRAFVLYRPPAGLGFDAALADALRDRLRGAVAQASQGAGARIDLNAVAGALAPPADFPAAWTAVQCLENHDLTYAPHAGARRLAALADGAEPRSWYARSRCRVANGLLMTAPGIPMLFMGQEFLADRNWNDNTQADPSSLIRWDRLDAERDLQDFVHFMRDLIALRRRADALRGERVQVIHVHADNRVLAFQRWIDGADRTLVVVASLNETTWYGYRLGFPGAGRWRELFNSDVYDHFPNPVVAGNGGGVEADGSPLHGLPAAAAITIPANALLVFGR